MDGVSVGFILASLILVAALWRLMRPRAEGGARLPPVKTGWLPWVGCAVPFGKEPLYFIQKTKAELGSDIFTIHAAGKMMTFVTNPKDYQHYFQTTLVDFQAAVQPFTQAAAGLSSESFFSHHTAIHDTVKGRLASTYLTKMCPVLSRGFYDSLRCHDNEGEMELMEFVRSAMFDAVVKQLFGHRNVPQTKSGMCEFQQKFFKYDEDFEYGVEIPEIFLKDWRDCKHWLLSVFKLMVEGIRERGTGREEEEGRHTGDKRLVEHLMDAVDEPSAHSYALLLLWASQANAVPMVFWTLAKVLTHRHIYQSLLEELNFSITTEDGEFSPISEDMLKGMMSVKRAALETTRLHSPGMIPRKVLKTHTISGYTVPAGHLLMLSPYWSHRNPEKFPDPEKFDPDRWLGCDLDKNQFLDGFVGFGGGRYQCPGRWFALMEMHLFLVMVLRMFDLELLDPLPPPSPLHLVGTQQPAASCRVRFRRRK